MLTEDFIEILQTTYEWGNHGAIRTFYLSDRQINLRIDMELLAQEWHEYVVETYERENPELIDAEGKYLENISENRNTQLFYEFMMDWIDDVVLTGPISHIACVL